MASGVFAILDDIAILADDIALSTKIATQKTAGILGDDLAVNAEKATGFKQERELKVIWQITKSSLKNKIIILPIAFILSALAPWIIPIILVFGGLYLLYEGAEKIEEFFHKKSDTSNDDILINSTNEDILKIEKEKIKSAVLTDFILSIEIIIIALGTVLDKPLTTQIISVTIVALIATFGVYGIVALIVRIDNLGFWCIKKKKVDLGNFFISLMPKLIKTLSIVGTIAMILVGGGILSHNIEFVHHLFISAIPSILNEFTIGLIVGFIVLFIINKIKILRKKIA
jgi:predicted DNA repair protein MutK